MARALCSIGVWNFPTPATYKGLTSTLVDSGRNAEGRMIGSVIRSDVAKVEMTWRYLTTAQWADICSKFESSTGGKFIQSVTFFNQVTGTWSTRDMYVNDRTTGGAYMIESSGGVSGWVDCALNLIEV